MRQFFLYGILLLAVCAARPAQAETAEDIVSGEHPEYYSCGKDEECVAVKGLCGEWRVVNTRNEKKLTDAINYLSVAVNCKEYAAPRSQPNAGCSPDKICQLGH